MSYHLSQFKWMLEFTLFNPVLASASFYKIRSHKIDRHYINNHGTIAEPTEWKTRIEKHRSPASWMDFVCVWSRIFLNSHFFFFCLKYTILNRLDSATKPQRSNVPLPDFKQASWALHELQTRELNCMLVRCQLYLYKIDVQKKQF